MNRGALRCEACGLAFEAVYGAVGSSACEVHHKLALATGPRATKLEDLAILCANCHSVIHRIDPMPDVPTFSKEYLSAEFQSATLK